MLHRNAICSYMEIDGTLYPIGDGFTRFAFRARPKEYTRTYFDEHAERTDAVGYEDVILYAFEAVEGDAVTAHMLTLLADPACCDPVTVVTVFPQTDGNEALRAKKQRYTLCPDVFGDGTEALVCKGHLAACGAAVYGNFDESALTFTEDADLS